MSTERRSTAQLVQDARMWASRAFVRSLAPPDWLSVNVTLKCNLSCVMCTTCYDAPELSTTELKRLVDEAAHLGVRVFNPLGGEPLVRQDLEEVLEHAVERGMFVTLTTNGTLLRPERAARLAHISPARLHLNLSLDGPESAHDAVRGKGNFARAIAGYHALRAADAALGNPLRTIRANVLLHRGNLHHFEEFLGWLEALGITGVQQLTLFRNAHDADVGGMWFRDEDLPALDALCDRLARGRASGQGSARLLVNPPDDLRRVPRYYREGLRPTDAPCWAGWKELYVNADGNTVMCDGKLDFLAGTFGNVRRTSLEEIWRSPALAQRRQIVKKCTTPCIQGCYLRRESDSLAPIVKELARNEIAPARAHLARRMRSLRPPNVLDLDLVFEASAVRLDDADPRFARSVRTAGPDATALTAAQVRAAPLRLREAWSRGAVRHDEGFGGEPLLTKILDDLDASRLRVRSVHLGWRGDAGLHPALDRLVARVLARELPITVGVSPALSPIHALPAGICGGIQHVGRPVRIVTWDARVLTDLADHRQAHVIGNAWEEDAAAVLLRD